MVPPAPVSAVAVARTLTAAPVTAIWNASNSFRAACMRAPGAARGGADGRIFSAARAVQTSTARAGAAAASAEAARGTSRRRDARIGRLPAVCRAQRAGAPRPGELPPSLPNEERAPGYSPYG